MLYLRSQYAQTPLGTFGLTLASGHSVVSKAVSGIGRLEGSGGQAVSVL